MLCIHAAAACAVEDNLVFSSMSQAHEQLQADVLRYKAKIEDLEKELTMKGQVGHSNTPMNASE